MRGVLIDYSDALRLVNDEIVKEGPTYVHGLLAAAVAGTGTCANVQYDSEGNLIGSCLVGRALIAAGVDPQRFIDTECVDGDVYDALHSLPELGMTRKAMSFLQAVQSRQDNGSEWGEAVDYAVQSVHGHFDDLDDVDFL